MPARDPYDVVIVGGGPAGLSTAIHLVRRRPELVGSVLVLEKERYPRDKYCGGAIGSRGVRLLERAGVLPDVPAVSIDAISFRGSGTYRRVDRQGMGIVVRRTEFDHALARALAARGVEVRDFAGVDRVQAGEWGALVHLTSGEAIPCRAVVGADGVGSRVRRSMGLPAGRLLAQVIEVDTETVASDLERSLHFDFVYGDQDGYAWDFPTCVAGRLLACRGVYRIRSRAGRGGTPANSHDDVAARLDAWLASKGLNPARYRRKRFAERGFDASAPVATPRVLLVGEAAGIDIVTGEGIAQALQYGAMAGPYLANALNRDYFGFEDWIDHIREGVTFAGWGHQ